MKFNLMSFAASAVYLRNLLQIYNKETKMSSKQGKLLPKPYCIPRTYTSEVGRISKLETFLGKYSFIPDKTNTFALNSTD